MPNCHPKFHRKNYAAWCEECEAVFDSPDLAKEHQDKTKHKIKLVEYLVSEAHFLPYFLPDKAL